MGTGQREWVKEERLTVIQAIELRVMLCHVEHVFRGHVFTGCPLSCGRHHQLCVLRPWNVLKSPKALYLEFFKHFVHVSSRLPAFTTVEKDERFTHQKKFFFSSAHLSSRWADSSGFCYSVWGRCWCNPCLCVCARARPHRCVRSCSFVLLLGQLHREMMIIKDLG